MRTTRNLALLVIVLCAGLLTEVSRSEDDYEQGRLLFAAGADTVAFADSVAALVFDTLGGAPSDPAWMFIGDLKVDSLLMLDYSIVPLTDSTQMVGTTISSEDLIDALDSLRTNILAKAYWGYGPEDTLYYDPVFDQWHVESDMSIYYMVGFSEVLSRVVDWLFERFLLVSV